MPDPLYILTAVAAVGLAVWAVLALVRPGEPERREPPRTTNAAERRDPLPTSKADEPAKAVVAEATGTLAPTTPTATVLTGMPKEIEDEPTGPNTLILVTAVGRTDPGLKRAHNEDAFAILPEHQLFVIADGMGRHAAGEVASQLCVEAITEAFLNLQGAAASPAAPTELTPRLPHRAARLRDAILSANRRVLGAAQGNDAYHGMGTTVVSAYFAPKNQRVYIAHVGDSRCYRLREDELRQLTMDHTLGAAGITGKSAALLSRAVGIEENVDVDVLIESPLPGDVYLLCSDGLSRMVDDELIKTTLRDVPDLDEVTKILIEKANAKGGRDNITTILVRVDNPLPGS